MAEPADLSPPSVTLVKEMGLTVADFVRTLPNASAPFRLSAEGLCFRLQAIEGAAEVRIEITELPARRIASLSLPVLRVALRFQHFTEAQRRQFLERFDLYFHKGGG